MCTSIENGGKRCLPPVATVRASRDASLQEFKKSAKRAGFTNLNDLTAESVTKMANEARAYSAGDHSVEHSPLHKFALVNAYATTEVLYRERVYATQEQVKVIGEKHVDPDTQQSVLSGTREERSAGIRKLLWEDQAGEMVLKAPYTEKTPSGEAVSIDYLAQKADAEAATAEKTHSTGRLPASGTAASTQLFFSFTAKEREQLKASAEKVGLTVSRYILTQLLEEDFRKPTPAMSKKSRDARVADIKNDVTTIRPMKRAASSKFEPGRHAA